MPRFARHLAAVTGLAFALAALAGSALIALATIALGSALWHVSRPATRDAV
jgi:hypothetical protein